MTSKICFAQFRMIASRSTRSFAPGDSAIKLEYGAGDRSSLRSSPERNNTVFYTLRALQRADEHSTIKDLVDKKQEAEGRI